MGNLLEMGVRRRKKFSKKRNIGDSGVHAAHQALTRRFISMPLPALDKSGVCVAPGDPTRAPP